MLQVHLITYSFTLSIIQTICDTHLFCSLVDPADSRQGKLLKERSQGVKEAMAHQPGDVFHRHLCFEGPNHPPPTKCTHPCLITWEIWTIYVDGAWDLGGLRLWAELFFFLLVWLTFHFLSIMSTGAQHTQAYVLHVEAGFVWPMFFAVRGEMFFSFFFIWLLCLRYLTAKAESVTYNDAFLKIQSFFITFCVIACHSVWE